MARSGNEYGLIDSVALKRYASVSTAVDETRARIAAGEFVPPAAEIAQYVDRELEQSHLDAIQGRRRTKAHLLGRERQIGTTHDILSIEFFEAGLIAARAIGRITIGGGVERGTGVLVGHDLVLTNNHVLPSSARAHVAEFDIDFEENRFGATKTPRHFRLEPNRFFCTHQELDFTIVAVAPDAGDHSLKACGWHPLIEQQGKICVGGPINLVHHPSGRTKSVTVHNSNLLHIEDEGRLSDFAWYSSDTEPGSSGAPVFNNRWEIVALHRRSVPKPQGEGYAAVDGETLSAADVEAQPHRAVWIANEGVRVSRIVAAVGRAEFAEPAQALLRDEVLELWRQTNAGAVGRESFARAVAPSLVDERARSGGRGRRLRVEIDLD